MFRILFSILLSVASSCLAPSRVSARFAAAQQNGWVVTSAVFSPDGKTLAAGSLDGQIVLYETKMWRIVNTIETGCFLYALAFSPDGAKLASASGDGVVRVWDSSSYKQIKSLRIASTGIEPADIEAIAFSEDSRRLAAGDDSGEIRIWSLETDEVYKAFKQNCGVSNVAFQLNGRRLVTSGCKSIIAWDTNSGEAVDATPPNSYDAFVSDPSGKLILTSAPASTSPGEANSLIELRKPGSIEAVRSMNLTDRITALAFGPSGNEFALGRSDGNIEIRGADKNALQKTLPIQGAPFTNNTPLLINSISFQPSGNLIAAAYGSAYRNGGGVEVWNIESGLRVVNLAGSSRVREPFVPGTGNMGGGDPLPKPPGDVGQLRTPGMPEDYSRNFNAKDVTQKARIRSKPEPQYTERARRNGVTGTVVLRAVLSSNGEVTNVKLIVRLPFGLNQQSIHAAKLIRFEPAVKDGRTVSQWIQIEYHYNLY